MVSETNRAGYDDEYVPFDVTLIAGLFTAFTCFLGVLVSMGLTWIKYKSDYSCNADWFSKCAKAGSMFDCAKVMGSDASNLMGLPITIFATAMYVVALLTALSIAYRKNFFYGVDRMILVAICWLSLLTTIVMALYSKLHLDTWCLYCSVMYLISIMFFVSGLWASRNNVLYGLKTFVWMKWLKDPGYKGVVTASAFFLLATIPQVWAFNSATCGATCDALTRNGH